MSEIDQSGPRDQPSATRVIWPLVFLLSLAFHGLLLFLMAQIPKFLSPSKNTETINIELVPQKPFLKETTPKEIVHTQSPMQGKNTVAGKTLQKSVGSGQNAIAAGKEKADAQDSGDSAGKFAGSSLGAGVGLEKGTGDLPGLDSPSTQRILQNIASEDARIRRMLDKTDVGPFATTKKPSKFDLPKELKYDDIRRAIAVAWNPDWSQIKDEGISEVSISWVKEGLKGWFKNWQQQIKENSKKNGAPDKLDESIAHLQDAEYASNTIVVDLDLEPLMDGTYAVSIAKPSQHPFFDRHALAEIKAIASNLPPWTEGYGHVLRYRLVATFIIVPPSASTLIGLSCAFPFCTPEELKNLEVIHWFKKIITKNIYFEGLIAPPALFDGGM